MTDFVRVDSLGGTLRTGALGSDNRGGQTLIPIMMPILLAKIGTIIGARSLGLTSTNMNFSTIMALENCSTTFGRDLLLQEC
ncbi:hypothetical protein SCHPADRAFT_611290 [Schizopora paradoxa]|uniref:Uncharacterized protein n=1 Tax=Schizopora paradoxa TaxID=27342 RepID=A0A0H2RU60_9AGAM|nr:hypothetical protein SCHPADRAFT_611290 [Schizopora paradoxa]